MPIRPMGRGLEIQSFRTRVAPSHLAFGPVKGAVLDDLVMRRR
jgi:hypothetical protein